MFSGRNLVEYASVDHEARIEYSLSTARSFFMALLQICHIMIYFKIFNKGILLLCWYFMHVLLSVVFCTIHIIFVLLALYLRLFWKINEISHQTFSISFMFIAPRISHLFHTCTIPTKAVIKVPKDNFSNWLKNGTRFTKVSYLTHCSCNY